MSLARTPPTNAQPADDVVQFIGAVDLLLRNEHHEDYCGIVYTDSKIDPTFVKIFDPNNLGASCGFSDNLPPPGWVLSLMPPNAVEPRHPPSARRWQWWRMLWPQ